MSTRQARAPGLAGFASSDQVRRPRLFGSALGSSVSPQPSATGKHYRALCGGVGVSRSSPPTRLVRGRAKPSRGEVR